MLIGNNIGNLSTKSSKQYNHRKIQNIHYEQNNY